MANIINSLTSGVGGVDVASVDTSGDLNIQSGGSTKIAVTSAGVAVTGTLSATTANANTLIANGATSGSVSLTAPSVAGTTSIVLPALSGDALVDIARSLSTNGYVKLSNGLTLQWGITGSITANTAYTVTFPTAFSTACLFATNIPTIAILVAQMAPVVTAVSTTTFTAYNSTGGANIYRWFAIGY